jgi:hypothetical protein
MTVIKNIEPLSAEKLFDLLKKEFTDYINSKLDSALVIEFAHVYDVINVSFPEVTGGTFLTLTVTDEEIVISDNARQEEYNTILFEQHLVDFVTLKAS